MTAAPVATQGDATPFSIPMNPIDRLFAIAPEAGFPWTIHCELRLSTPVDIRRLEAALRSACQVHPLSRARRSEASRFAWTLNGPQPTLRVVAADESELGEWRDLLISEDPTPIAAAVLRSPKVDTLLLTVSHAVADGVGASRFAATVLDAYDGQVLPDLEAPWALGRNLEAADHEPPPVARPNVRGPIARLRPVGGAAGAKGYGYVETDLTICAGRAPLHDVMLAGVALAVRRWNGDTAQAPTVVMVPVNLRPASSWRAGMFNAVLPYPVVNSEKGPGEVLAGVRSQMRPLRLGSGGSVVRGLAAAAYRSPALPTWMRLLALNHTTVFSNLGDVGRSFANRAGVAGVAGSTTPTPGAGIVFMSWRFRGRLYLAARYRKDRFDAGAAADLLKIAADAAEECQAVAPSC